MLNIYIATAVVEITTNYRPSHAHTSMSGTWFAMCTLKKYAGHKIGSQVFITIHNIYIYLT